MSKIYTRTPPPEEPQPFKMIINGYAQHGKDTVADMFAEKLGITKPSASHVIARYLVTSRLPQGWYEGTLEEQIEEAYQDRMHHRTGWFNFVDQMGRDTLVKECLKLGDIYCGERCKINFQKTRHLFKHHIWVDATGRGKPVEPESSCTITSAGHITIHNDGDLELLEQRVDDYIRLFIGDEIND